MYNSTIRTGVDVPQPAHPDWLNVNRMHVTLRRAYLATTEQQRAAGMDWYPSAFRFAQQAAGASGLPVENVVAALAHLSPRVRWGRNKTMLLELLVTGETSGLRGNIERAKLALESGEPLKTLTGRKVASFARNILGEHDVVTVDRWAARLADPSLDVTRSGISPKQYDQVERAYVQAARFHEITPADLQAVLWVAARGKAE